MIRKLAVCIDLGGTNVRIALGDEEGHIITRLSEETEKKSGPEGVSDQIIKMIRRVEKRTNRTQEIQGICIGSVGPLDLKRGGLVKPPNIPYDFVPLVEPLEDEFGLPTHLINDGSSGVMGERFFGAGKAHENLAYITLSTGIGGGIYVDGHLLVGKDGNAAEIGHFTIDCEGRLLCGCGKRGHWETYCSGEGIPNFVRLLIKNRRKEELENSLLMKTTGNDLSKITAKTIYEAATAEDPLSRELVEEIGVLNAIGFACVTDAYDPSLITVGGTIALENEYLVLETIRRHVNEHAINRVPEIMITPLRDEAVLFGALGRFFHSNV